MKKLFFLTLLFFSLTAVGQSYTSIDPTLAFNARLSKELSQIKSIESDFIQLKYMDILSEKIESKGRFYYRSDQKIALNYTTPLSYQLIINGDKLTIVNDGKKNTVSLKSNGMMKEILVLLTACMTGNLSIMQGNYQLHYFENKQNYLVKITPQNASIRTYLSSMEITLAKKDMSVIALRLNESGNNYTEYRFENRKYNTLINDNAFTTN